MDDNTGPSPRSRGAADSRGLQKAMREIREEERRRRFNERRYNRKRYLDPDLPDFRDHSEDDTGDS